MDSQISLVPPELRRAASELVAALRESAPFKTYAAARSRLEEDEQARGLLEAAAQVEWDVRRMQAQGTMTREDIDRLRSARASASSNPIVLALEAAQAGVMAYLPQVNAVVTEALGVDIAALSRAGGCC